MSGSALRAQPDLHICGSGWPTGWRWPIREAVIRRVRHAHPTNLDSVPVLEIDQRSGARQDVVGGDVFEGAVRRLGLGEEVALGKLAAFGLEETQLHRRFHPFGHHRHAQAMAELDDGAYHFRVVRVVGDVADETLVDLQP